MKPKEVKISEVFHLAADVYLKTCHKEDIGGNQYSCIAVRRALADILKEHIGEDHGNFHVELQYHLKVISRGLINMGLINPNKDFYFIKFEDGYEPTIQSQGARYLWLKWAALMAEEQGE